MNNILSVDKVSNLCIYIVLILVNISYCPGIILTPNYKIIVAVIMIAIIISLVVNIWKDLNIALSLYLYYGVYALTISSLVFLWYDIFVFQVSYNIFLTITCFLLGYSCRNHSDKFIMRCMRIYILSALFLGLYSVYTNLGEFVISEQYAFAVKNSSGVLLGTAIILSSFIIGKTKNKIIGAGELVIIVLLCACLLTFRCRTAIFSVFLAILWLLHRKHLLRVIIQKPLFLFSLILIFILVITFDIIPFDYIFQILVLFSIFR